MTNPEPLCRSVPFTVTRDDVEAGDGLTLDGLATPFGRDLKAGEDPSVEAGWTFIDSWEGQFWERFVPGSFKKTLRERTPMMQYDHGRHPLIGSIPLGTYDVVEESDDGVHVVGRLIDNWLIQPVRDAIAARGITGMSIRFVPLRDIWSDQDGKTVKAEDLDEALWYGTRGVLRRTVQEAKLLEAGPVAWPAYEQTAVGVRALEAASAVRSNPALVRDMRRSLATGRHSAVEQTLRDLGVQLAEAARALLLIDPSMPPAAPSPAPARAVTPDPTPLPEADVSETDAAAIRDIDIDSEPPAMAPAVVSTATPDAPPAVAPVRNGRTSTKTDAPPSGHPSNQMSDQEARQHKARLNYLTLNRVGKYKR